MKIKRISKSCSTYIVFFRADTTVTYNEALFYASGIIVSNVLKLIVDNHIIQFAYVIGMRMRLAVCSLFYRKALRLSQTALGETSPGKMVNLLTNDVNRFDFITFVCNALWIAPLLTFIVFYLLWFEVGFVGFFGMLVIFLVVPLLSKCSFFIWIFSTLV